MPISLTSLFIAFVRFKPPKLMSFMGKISYSVYLLHVPIGGRVLSIGRRFANTSYAFNVIVLILALAITVLSSYIVYIYVERPAKIWSSSLRYKSKDDDKINIETNFS